MIAEVVALLIAAAIGVALARLVDRTASGALLAGEGILLGIGAMAAILFVFAIAGVAWTRIGVAVAVIAIGMVAPLTRRFAPPSPRGAGRGVFSPFDVVTLVLLAGYARLATIAPVWEVDYIADFGLKARNFWEVRGIDWGFLEAAFGRNAHPDYPPLLPLSFDFLALARGAWNDAAHGLLNVAFAVALLLVVRRLALEETESAHAAAFLAAAFVPLAASPWIGIGEAPLVAFGTTALLLIRRGSVVPGAVMLGLAASAKNEGLTLIVAAAAGLAVAKRWRDVVRLWPAVVIPLPWLVLRQIHHLRNDITEGNVVARIVEHLRHPKPLLNAVVAYNAGRPLFWLALAVGIVVVIRPLIKGERFVLVALAVQLLFYLAAYLATPHDVLWHVRWSWERLISHLSPALTYVVLVRLLTTRAEMY